MIYAKVISNSIVETIFKPSWRSPLGSRAWSRSLLHCWKKKVRWCPFSSQALIKPEAQLLIPHFWLMRIFGNHPSLNVVAMGNVKSKVILARLHSCFGELWTMFSFALSIVCIRDDIFAHITSPHTWEKDLLGQRLWFKMSLWQSITFHQENTWCPQSNTNFTPHIL